MELAERPNDREEGIRAALEGLQAGIWTAMPGIIVDFDPVAQTATVQPAILGVQTNKDGTRSPATMPQLSLCPVVFPHGGGLTITFPVRAGDECLIVFASRCIDSWWQSGGVQTQAEQRMHDISDGFVICGPRAKPNALANFSTTAAQFRTDGGETYVEIDPDSHIVTIKSPVQIRLDAPEVLATQDMTVNGDLFVNGESMLAGPVTTGDIAQFADVVTVGEILSVPEVEAQVVILGGHFGKGKLTVDELTVNDKTTLSTAVTVNLSKGGVMELSGDLHVTGASALDGLVASLNDVLAQTVSLVTHAHVAISFPPTNPPATGLPHVP